MSDDGHAPANWALFRAPHPALIDVGLVCLGAGEQGGEFPSFFDRTLASHALVIVTEGKGRIWGAGGMRTAADLISPSYFWVPPGRSHGYGPTASGWTEHWMLFSGATTSVFGQLGIFEQKDALTPRAFRGGDVVHLFSQLHAALELEGPAGDLGASSVSLQIIANLTPAASGVEDAAVTILRSNAFQPLPLALQAKALGISQEELYRRVLTTTGLTPKEFIIHLRLQRAQGLLAETGLPIHEVARASGYEDPAYFSRFFSSRVGVPPSTFRTQQRRGLPINRQLPAPEGGV